MKKMIKFDLCEKIITAPHTLICGSTGSGKSTLLNATICTFIATMPKCKSLILIDTKKVELYAYKDIHHTLDYVDEIDDIVFVLDKCNKLMRMRFNVMRTENIKRYTYGDVWIIIDEIADLMNSYRANEIKRLLIPLLQLGRACGIHIIGGTQAPNRRTLPAEIVSNFTMRIGLKTLSHIESIQAIGIKGCERLPLIGYGYVVDGNNIYLSEMPYLTEEQIEKQIKECR